ncbi:MAG: glutathione S-transferase N-terminal domain-containing protein [Solirubrobacterales bacterium]
MILYTCGQKKSMASLGHPCGRAAKALDQAGYEYELRPVKGYRFALWTRPSRNKDRAEIKALSGTNEVPVLVLDDGTVISDSSRIVRWTREHPRAQPPAS